ncbi:hypothetical protein KBD13_02565 [Patescibacteria group bacterium]|nr:hypothetical protein [Patescibacteria group bacterium]MDQ5919496.1 hypothetical protein [Patescibacteria group bacterium]
MASFERRFTGSLLHEAGERDMAERALELLTRARALRRLAQDEARSLRSKEQYLAEGVTDPEAMDKARNAIRVGRGALAKIREMHGVVMREIVRDIVLNAGVLGSIRQYGSLRSWMLVRGVLRPSVDLIEDDLREIETLLRQLEGVSSRLGKGEDDR